MLATCPDAYRVALRTVIDVCLIQLTLKALRPWAERPHPWALTSMFFDCRYKGSLFFSISEGLDICTPDEKKLIDQVVENEYVAAGAVGDEEKKQENESDDNGFCVDLMLLRFFLCSVNT